jgi:hypothetical protein
VSSRHHAQSLLHVVFLSLLPENRGQTPNFQILK